MFSTSTKRIQPSARRYKSAIPASTLYPQQHTCDKLDMGRHPVQLQVPKVLQEASSTQRDPQHGWQVLQLLLLPRPSAESPLDPAKD